MRGNDARKFTQSVEEITGILEQARSYATGQNTYVWVAFYPLDPSTLAGPDKDQSGSQLYVATYASTDGTDPVNWGNPLSSVSIPYPSAASPSIIQIAKVKVFKQLQVAQSPFSSEQIPAMPSAMNSPTAPSSAVAFSLPLRSPSLVLSQQTPPTGAQAILVIGFTPSGSAQVSPALAAEIGLDLEPVRGGVTDTNNIVALRISGLVGLTTIYRK